MEMNPLIITVSRSVTMVILNYLCFVIYFVGSVSVILQNVRSVRPRTTGEHLDRKYGPFIVHLDRGIDHNQFVEMVRAHESVNQPFTRFRSSITHRFNYVCYGLVIEGITKAELHSLPMVVSVSPVTQRKINIYSWGLDRVNQRELPLDHNVSSTYGGHNVDVYVIDTGLDTSHIEFQGNSKRIVANIFSAFVTSNDHLPPNTDMQGHGTHVAGTIGGRTVGVAPSANIYSLRVLNDSGEGDTSDIIDAINVVVGRASRQGANPSVISMSLGGPCDEADCSRDALVMAVEEAVAAGVVVSVAAGNEGCNACSGSPNAAPNAINGTYVVKCLLAGRVCRVCD